MLAESIHYFCQLASFLSAIIYNADLMNNSLYKIAVKTEKISKNYKLAFFSHKPVPFL